MIGGVAPAARLACHDSWHRELAGSLLAALFQMCTGNIQVHHSADRAKPQRSFFLKTIYGFLPFAAATCGIAYAGMGGPLTRVHRLVAQARRLSDLGSMPHLRRSTPTMALIVALRLVSQCAKEWHWIHYRPAGSKGWNQGIMAGGRLKRREKQREQAGRVPQVIERND